MNFPQSCTYSEAEGRGTFDWNEFLTRRAYTEEQLWDARLKAGSWVTCACGNQCNVIPRDDIGMPFDLMLSDLGMHFYSLIVKAHGSFANMGITSFYRHLNNARAVLQEIEKRSAELIPLYTNR